MKEKIKKERRIEGMKGNRGITLIALIITIIVMLILVAVTINVAINGGLFGHAQNATDLTREAIAQETELSKGQITIDGVVYDSPEDYVAGNPALVTKNKWTRSGDNLSYEDENGENHENVLQIGDEVNYTPVIAKEGTTIGNQRIASIGMPDMIIVAVAPAAPTRPTTTITADQSGLTASQTIEQEELPWVVLGIADQNNDGTNETLLLTTKTATTAKITLKGAAAYNNGPRELNRMCKELYGRNARNMNIEDVNNCFNVTLQDGGLYFKADGNPGLLPASLDTLADLAASVEVPTPEKLSSLTSDQLTELQGVWNLITRQSATSKPKFFLTPDGKQQIENSTGDLVEDNTLGNYNLDVIGYQKTDGNIIQMGSTSTTPLAITEAARNVIYSEGTMQTVSKLDGIKVASKDISRIKIASALPPGGSYWLSSRGVFPYANYGFARFGPGYVRGGFVYSGNYFFYSNGNEYDNAFGLRPVVSLTSEIPAVATPEPF